MRERLAHPADLPGQTGERAQSAGGKRQHAGAAALAVQRLHGGQVDELRAVRAKEREELAIIEKFLPQQLSADELHTELRAIIAQVGAKTPADMGKVMGVASKQLAGRADGKAISEAVKQLLAQ